VFDYNKSTIEGDLILSLSGRTLVGVLDVIGGNATIVSCNVLHKVAGKGRVATTKRFGDYTPPKGVVLTTIFATTLAENHVGKGIYESFLPGALAKGSYVASPAAEVAGHGLEAIRGAVNRVTRGVSAKKLVVTL
jgi:hypothetical protein